MNMLSYILGKKKGGGGGGTTTAGRKDVNFYDYDGSIVASYTTEEFANITALPSNPTHTGLTAQGWNMPSNWSLADAKTYIATNKKADWGQMYITDDGKTRVYIHLEKGRLSPMLGCCPNGTVDVDWGDGTAHDTLTGTNTSTVKWTSNHTYAAPGDYVIKLTVTGSIGLYGYNSSDQYSGMLRYASTGDSRNYVYQNAIQKVEIGRSVTSIGDDAFRNCYSLANVIISNGVTSIGDDAFRNCNNLASITVPDSVTNIGGYAFQNCYSLVSITIPDSVTSISSYAFYNCYSLVSITIPDSVTSINNNAFNGCYGLASVTIPDSVTSIGGSAFTNCYSLASVTIPDGVTSISGVFLNCFSLASISIPDSITSIGDGAFQNCYSLASITIPDSVTSIGGSAFRSCYSLASVTIPDGVTSISGYAFNGCNGLAELHFLPSSPPTVYSSNAFTGIPADCKIYVPTGKLEAYTSASNYPNSNTYTYVEE